MKCSRSAVALVVWCVALAAGWTALPVQAQEQFVLLDVEYTATAQNTMDSHYRVKPKAGIPGNWRAPVNYANGTVYVELEVLEKAGGNTNTLYNICIENASNPACLPYMMYTNTGKYRANFAFSRLWQYDVVDWAMGCTEVSLILKDSTETKQQGNANFYPYKARVVLTVVPPGGTYVPPGAGGAAGSPAAGSGTGAGAGRGGSGGMPASAGRAGSAAGSAGRGGSGGSSSGMSMGAGGRGGSAAASNSGGSGGSKPSSTAGTSSTPSSGGQSGSSTAGRGGSSAASPGSSAANGGSTAGTGTLGNEIDDRRVSAQLESTGGCSSTGHGRAGAGWFLLGLLLLVRRRR